MEPVYVTHDAIRSKPSTVAGGLILAHMKREEERYKYRFYQRILLDMALDLQRRLRRFGDERMRPPGDVRLGGLPTANLFWEVDPITTAGRSANYLSIRNTQPRIMVPGYNRRRGDVEFVVPIAVGEEMKSFLYGNAPRDGSMIRPKIFFGTPEIVSGEELDPSHDASARALAWHTGYGEKILRARARGIPYGHPQKVNARRIFYNIIRESVRKSFKERVKAYRGD